MLAWLAGASLASAQIVPTDAPGIFDPPDTEYTTGDDEGIDPAIYRSLSVVDRHRAFLPASVDLTSRMPFPGNQGKLGSCQAWATAYAARSYYTSKIERRDLRESQNVPSPNYVFHLARNLDKSCDAGSNVHKIVEVLKKGALSLAEYPYNTECAAPPAAASRRQGLRFSRARLSKSRHSKKSTTSRANCTNPTQSLFHLRPALPAPPLSALTRCPH